MRCKGGANPGVRTPRPSLAPPPGTIHRGCCRLTHPGLLPGAGPALANPFVESRLCPPPRPLGGAGSPHRLQSVFFLRLSFLVLRFSHCLSIAGKRAGRCLLLFFRSPRAFWVRVVETSDLWTSFKAAPLCQCGSIGLPPIRAVCVCVCLCVWVCVVCLFVLCVSIRSTCGCLYVSVVFVCLCWGVCVCVHLSVYVSGVCVYVYVCFCGIYLCAGESLYTGFEGHSLEMRGG